jgi:hypothetical protein
MRSWLVGGFCYWKPGSTRIALETKPATISFGVPQGLHAARAHCYQR